MFRNRFRRMAVPRYAFLLAFALWMSLLAGCAQALPKAEPVEIVFAHWEADTTYYQSSLEAFTRQFPEIQVKLVPIPRDALDDPDIVEADCFVQPANNLGRFRQGGEAQGEALALSLDELIQTDDGFNLDDFYPGAQGLVSSGSRVWAVPAGISPIVMFYNRDLFIRRGVPFPEVDWDWDDFLNAALALRDAENGIWGYGPNPQVDPLLFVYSHGGRIFDDLQNPTRTTFDDPLTVQALEWYAGLFHDSRVAPPTRGDIGPGNSYLEAVYRGIFAGQIGMWSGSLQERTGVWFGERQGWPFELGVLPFPRDYVSATYAEVEVYVISASTERPQGCWQWISFLSRQVSSEYRLTPARRSLVESADYERLVGSDVAATVRAALQDAIMPPSFEKFAAFQTELSAYSRAVEMIAAGQLSAEEAMEYIQQAGE